MARILALLDDRPGNNHQVLGVAEKLGLGFEMAKLRYNNLIHLPFSLIAGATTRLMDARLEEGAILGPPWPDVIISAGRRASRTAVQIKRHVRAVTSNEHDPFLVQLMRPAPNPDYFSLLVVPEHDGRGYIPDEDELKNTWVMRPLLSAHDITPVKLADAKRIWEPQFAHLPHPWIGVLIGGTSKHAEFTIGEYELLTKSLAEATQNSGGSLLVTSSRRTDKAGIAKLKSILGDIPHFLYEYGNPGENPYKGILSCADSLIVTGDSISMLSEAAGAAKPLFVFTPPKIAPKFERFTRGLYEKAIAKPFVLPLNLGWQPAASPDTAQEVADKIKEYLSSRSLYLTLPPPPSILEPF